MKLAIIGSRKFTSETFVKRKIKLILDIAEYEDVMLISGGARGVDTWAEEVFDEYNFPKDILKPNWNKYGKKAGFLRNQLIIDEADKVIAFWDGSSKGTKHSIDLAIKKDIPIDIYIR